MSLGPFPTSNVPISGASPLSDTWQRYFASLDQFARSRPDFSGPEASVADAAGVTLSASQLLAGVLIRSGPAGAFSDTTPTAAQIVSEIVKAEIGSNRMICIQNGGGGLMTVVAGAGVTLHGTTTIASGFARFYLVKVTALGSTAAVDLRGLMTGAV